MSAVPQIDFQVVRDADSPGNPTMGQLLVEGEPFCQTLELPWKDNEVFVSCIPVGIYKVAMLMSEHFGELMPHVLNVPGRTAEEIHAANTVHDLLGCIGVGDERGPDYSLAYPAHPASVRFNEWVTSCGGVVMCEVKYG